SLSTLFPENNKNPASFCLPYRPTPHLYPSSTQHSMSRLSTGNPVDYQAFLGSSHTRLGDGVAAKAIRRCNPALARSRASPGEDPRVVPRAVRRPFSVVVLMMLGL